ERGDGLLAGGLGARRDHLPYQLYVARLRVASEPDTGEEEPEVLLRHQLAGRRPAAGETLEHLAQPARPGQVRLRQRRDQHHAAHALGGDVGMARRERLQRDAAHRMPDEDGVVQIHSLEHGADVLGQVGDRVPTVTALGIAVPTMVEADAAEALLGKTLELLDPHPRRKGHAVREEDWRALPAAHRVDAPAVVARVPPGLVEGWDQRLAGVGV